jgi:hypothetical protein
MKQLQKRVEGLEQKRSGKLLPTQVHIVGVGAGQTKDAARRDYEREHEQSIGDDDQVIYLVGVEPRSVEATA